MYVTTAKDEDTESQKDDKPMCVPLAVAQSVDVVAVDPEEICKQAIACKKRKEHEEAVQLYTKATKSGHANSMGNLAMMYRKGRGVPKDLDKAKALLTQAIAIDECPIYMNRLGVVCKDKKEYPEAIRWYTEAAELGNANAANNFALMYLRGQGIYKDLDRAKIFLVQALSVHDKPLTMHKMALLCESKKECAEAMLYYSKALQAGHADSARKMIDLLKLYLQGGVDLPKDKLLEWLLTLREEGHANKMNRAMQMTLDTYDYMVEEMELMPGGAQFLQAKMRFEKNAELMDYTHTHAISSCVENEQHAE